MSINKKDVQGAMDRLTLKKKQNTSCSDFNYHDEDDIEAELGEELGSEDDLNDHLKNNSNDYDEYPPGSRRWRRKHHNTGGTRSGKK